MGRRKKKLIEPGSNLSIRISADDPPELIDFLNNQTNYTKSIKLLITQHIEEYGTANISNCLSLSKLRADNSYYTETQSLNFSLEKDQKKTISPENETDNKESQATITNETDTHKNTDYFVLDDIDGYAETITDITQNETVATPSMHTNIEDAQKENKEINHKHKSRRNRTSDLFM